MKAPRGGTRSLSLSKGLWGALGILLLAALWELYKATGPDDGVLIGTTRILPRTSDLAMPHVWDIVTRLFQSAAGTGPGAVLQPNAGPLWLAVAQAAARTLGIAAVGLVIGLAVGVGLALAMLAFRPVRWGIQPWIVLSQTVPLIAFAPLVRSWGSKIEIGSFEWADWMSVALIASYLAFFPIAIGVLAGFDSPNGHQLDLMRAYGVGWWRSLAALRLPASVPYLLTSVRLGAANAVIGAVVAEVSIGMQGGIGRMIIQFAGQASGDPPKVWAPILGAIALGLVAAGSVALVGMLLKNYRRVES
ncbi:MAG: ABC transporter permease subunit [Microbacterium sp.]